MVHRFLVTKVVPQLQPPFTHFKLITRMPKIMRIFNGTLSIWVICANAHHATGHQFYLRYT